MKDRILVADDDFVLLAMLEELLGDTYALSLAKSGSQAISLLETGYRPDLILLDVDMPDMDGYETMANMRRFYGMRDVPVLFLTGLLDVKEELKGLRSGASDYIRKPFEAEILKTRIEIHLEAGKKYRAGSSSNGQNETEEKGERLKGVLTPTEWEMAKLMADGYTNHEVGETLGYSYNYVKKVASRIFDKLELKKRTELRDFFR